MGNSATLILDGIHCERGGRILFNDFGLALNTGQGLRVKGENGSGKSTLLRIIAGLNQQYLGTVNWRGQNIRRHRYNLHRELLYLGHEPAIKTTLTPLENLEWWYALNEATAVIERSEDTFERALHQLGLAAYVDTPCQYLSAGQQRRAALARLFLSKHALWVLDEPFTAIDSRGVQLLESRCAEHIQQGGMLIITTHQELSGGCFSTLDIER